MPKTELKSSQIKNGEVWREDLNTATTGKAVITKVIAGTAISLSSTGADSGTGDVTINVVQSGITHNNLAGLTSGDPHTQYVHNTTARTITARHTFNPTSTNSPFIIGANAQNQLVPGLNADKLDGKDASEFCLYEESASPTINTFGAIWVGSGGSLPFGFQIYTNDIGWADCVPTYWAGLQRVTETFTFNDPNVGDVELVFVEGILVSWSRL